MQNDILSALLEAALQEKEKAEAKEEKKEEKAEAKAEAAPQSEKPPEARAQEGQTPQGNAAQAQIPLGIAMWLNYHAQLSAAKLDYDENLGAIGLPWDKVEVLIQQELASNVDRYSRDRWAVVSAYQAVKRRLIETYRQRPELFAALGGRSEAPAEEEEKFDPREAYIRWLKEDVFKQ